MIVQNTTENSKFLRLTVIISAVVGLLSLFSLTVTTLAYGTGQYTLFVTRNQICQEIGKQECR